MSNTGQNTLPRLSTESDLVTWAERIIKDETERQAAGLIPITLLPLESLQEKYDNYRAVRSNRDHAQDNSSKEDAAKHVNGECATASSKNPTRRRTG